ncbi:heat shock protein 90-6, mitochondrial-like [Tasmannia lanceolata]|uniref:heat shock protein 90-6, mitochondrial-like n=1 Tax=Tasmannia lanceolata TaxID=3420 RepID=UPI0040635351
MPLTSLFTPSFTTLPWTHKGKMLKLSKSFISATLRTGGVRYRILAPPILSSHVSRDDKGFAHPERIQNLVKNYSQFVSFSTWQEKGFTEEVESDEDLVPRPSGSSSGNPSPADIAGVARNHEGEVIFAYWEAIRAADTTEAEVCSVHYGVKLLASNNLKNAIIEGPSPNVNKWLNRDEKHPSRFDKFFDEIDDYQRSMDSPLKDVQRSANETEPIWLLNPKAVTTEEYNEFYKKTFNEYLDPLASSHFTTEGEVELRSILFVRATAPIGSEDAINPNTKNIRLYVKCAFVSDDFDGELFPRYLSFVKGVVDSNDLPLNVSREILKESRIVRIMRKILARKAFDMILDISMSENKEDYEKFWENFGKNLKLGCIEDNENQQRIAPLLRFFSSHSEEKLISLDEYVERMKPEQKDIYYIALDNLKSARNAPFLETLLEKDFEVLFLIDPIDEVAIQNLKTYKEKNFVNIRKEGLDLGDKNEENHSEVVEPVEAGGPNMTRVYLVGMLYLLKLDVLQK